MSEYSFPNLKQARFRDRSYQTNIVRNSVELTENQKILGNGLNYHVITYGCQANVRDGEVISGILEKMGYSYTEAFSQADIIILNTCAIRDNAEKKVLGEIGFLQSYKRKNPNMIIGLCGCMAQEEKVVETLTKKYPYVELIFGTHNINRLPQLIENIYTNKARSIEVFSKLGDIYEDLPSVRQNKHKAFVNIMDGCDKFCTYCIVPYTRSSYFIIFCRILTISSMVSSFPARMSWATQVWIWAESSSRLKAFSAAAAAEAWVKISIQ